MTTGYQYTPYTSEQLRSGGSESGPLSFISETLSDFSSINIPDVPTLPNGKQVIFFSLGMLCLISALALIEKTLITETAPELLKAATTAL